MNLGETICRLRTQAGLSQSDLADALEVSRQSVSKWETNASVPDLDRLVKMSEFFHVSLDELVKGSTEPEAASPSESGPSIASPQAVPAVPEPADVPRRTRARSVGIGLLCAAAVVAVLCIALFGLFGALFALPLFVPGLICAAARRHPALKALWAEFFLLDAYMFWATGIRASQVFLTLLWTPSMNYARLAFAWALFLCSAALAVGTALTLCRKSGPLTRAEKYAAVLAVAILLALRFPVKWLLSWFAAVYLYPGIWTNLLFFSQSWIQLLDFTLLACIAVRCIWAGRSGKSSAAP